MRKSIGALSRSVGFRLLFSVLVTFATLSVAYAVVSLRSIEQHWLGLVDACANRTSQLVRGAARYGMLLNRKEDVHETIRQIARTPAVAAIRIYDKQGKIIFSADGREIGNRVDMRSEACIGCHGGPPSAKPAHDRRVRRFRGPDGAGILGVIAPIENEPACANAACHAHPADQTVLGVLDVQMSTSGLEETVRTMRLQFVGATALLILLVGGLSALFFRRLVLRPVRRLHEGTRRVAGGDLDTRIELLAKDELGELAQAFNSMTSDLKRARNELTEWSERLEQKVVDKTQELGRAQRQIVQMEKMASLGKLAATVAHELNNPLAGILTYAKLVQRDLAGGEITEEERAELLRFLDLIQKESSRCGGIVKNLLLFSRRSGAELAPAHVNELVDRSLMLVRHLLEMAGVELQNHPLSGDDTIVCDADQVQQALVALLVNGVEAMQGTSGGTLSITVVGTDAFVEIEVADTGVGIAADALPHIFEPFFSTKEKESGVGLGLAVVYGIAQRHQGEIEVHSEVGRGATFRMRLPRLPGASPRSTTAATQSARKTP